MKNQKNGGYAILVFIAIIFVAAIYYAGQQNKTGVLSIESFTHENVGIVLIFVLFFFVFLATSLIEKR